MSQTTLDAVTEFVKARPRANIPLKTLIVNPGQGKWQTEKWGDRLRAIVAEAKLSKTPKSLL